MSKCRKKPAPPIPVTDPAGEWRGMPEFVQESEMPIQRIIVSFYSPEDIAAFAALVGRTITARTRGIAFPKRPQRMDVRGPYWAGK